MQLLCKILFSYGILNEGIHKQKVNVYVSNKGFFTVSLINNFWGLIMCLFHFSSLNHWCAGLSYLYTNCFIIRQCVLDLVEDMAPCRGDEA